ncbi:arylesterase [Tsuneonella mangrovi]|uniref:arylesterase n=1 Tax=Tsuneonella mangrovi TaxID=1982042 RepID=UPI000BA279E2|nr:arylesterase [Tsuneonella mangrovi]
MEFGKWSIGLAAALALAGCQQQSAPAPQPTASAASTDVASAQVSGPVRRILAFGDSLFAGYGLASPLESYPSQLQAALRQEGVNAQVVNAGVSGNTTADGLQRLDFTLESMAKKPDLVILELGGNDLLRGLPPKETRANLSAMLEKLKALDIPVLLMGMRAPPNGGPEFQKAFDGIYPDLAKRFGVKLVPFFIGSIYDKPQLLQADHIHPTRQGVEALVAATKAQVTAAIPPATK